MEKNKKIMIMKNKMKKKKMRINGMDKILIALL
jgi:translation initiation factor IF-1